MFITSPSPLWSKKPFLLFLFSSHAYKKSLSSPFLWLPISSQIISSYNRRKDKTKIGEGPSSLPLKNSSPLSPL